MKRYIFASSVFLIAIGAAGFSHATNKTKLTNYFDQNTCQSVSLPPECTNGSHTCTLSNGDNVVINSCTGTVMSKP